MSKEWLAESFVLCQQDNIKLRAENERLHELVTVACEFILATPPHGPVWKERRNAILDTASGLGMWKRSDVVRSSLAALEGEVGE
jgi:hypothetical protein